MTHVAAQRTAQVVVGVDRTGTHDNAVLTASLEHARRSGADLRVVHAITADVELPDAQVGSTTRRRQLAARHHLAQVAAADLRRQVHQLDASAAVHYDIQYGDPATIILAAAQHAELIVLGTHSDGNRCSPLLLGTVSQDIAVHATCPVLLIPAGHQSQLTQRPAEK
ncbi:universal stress protein [Spirilliplanes yamanashiensis]|uniref:Universal stress protein n=1 Tax=Spirilliplanes yamanashiensis TaxID=42233 RepID=A0A8J4DL18_9ACTN|nr:universal stress protein [Spirilliplanes yamanashiensis]MDP9817810.1 nucleotide-binding universal stress UspA family protein [Spirilliplanes yamanashiensis]GIJ04620.1 universal stress protein [Spirilliplanes yamanashiensis]